MSQPGEGIQECFDSRGRTGSWTWKGYSWNRVPPAIEEAVREPFADGWSKSRLAREFRLNRRTVIRICAAKEQHYSGKLPRRVTRLQVCVDTERPCRLESLNARRRSVGQERSCRTARAEPGWPTHAGSGHRDRADRALPVEGDPLSLTPRPLQQRGAFPETW